MQVFFFDFLEFSGKYFDRVTKVVTLASFRACGLRGGEVYYKEL